MKKKITEMNIGDKIKVEYGDYNNWTTAIIVDIKPTNYEHIKEVYFTIPNYTGDKVYKDRMIDVDIF